MPVYELSLVLRVLPRAEIASTLKRVGCVLMDKGAQLQKLENHGTKDLPYRFSRKEENHFKGSYFVYRFLSSPKIFPEVLDECTRDVDIIRHHLGTEYTDLTTPCTLNEEMLPPAFRQSVQDLITKSRKLKAKRKRFYRHVIEHNYDDIYK